jgi:exonuclease-1
MGIKGLLPALEHTKVPIDLEQLKGKRIAIDGHCWLHNGLTCCAYELETGVPTDK